MQRAVFDPVSNREHWINMSEVRDQDDALVDLSTAVIKVSLRERQSKRTLLHAEVGTGIVIEGLGVFSHTFTDQQMRILDASFQYEVGCTIELNGVVQQFYIGAIPIIDGIVP
jgi:hypothetical protein